MLSFTHPAFLFGFGALAVPVFLHLMNRQIPLRVIFPSIRFLHRAQLPRDGRRRLRDILLLLLRLLLLSAIILAFARPVWTPRVAVDPNRESAEAIVVFLLDCSASMSAGTSFAEAKTEILNRLDGLGPHERAGLIMSANSVITLQAPTGDRSALRDALEAATVSPVAGDHTEALDTATAQFVDTVPGRLLIVSDFQKGDWEKQYRLRLPENVKVALCPVGLYQHNNCGIVGVTTAPLGGKAIRLVARVRNFSDKPQSRKIYVPSQPEIAAVQLDIPPLSSRQAALVIPGGETKAATLKLSEDSYTLDDEFHVWTGEMPPAKIVAVVPLEQEPERASELYFVKKALTASDESHTIRFSVEVVEPEFFFALNLDSVAGILVLGGGSYFREAGFEKIHDFLADGGTVVMTPGRIPAQEFQGLRQQNLLSAKFIEIAGKDEKWGGGFGLGWVNPTSVLGTTFATPEKTDLFLFPIHKYVRFKEDENSTVLLKLIDGDPALIEKQIEHGNLYFSAIAFTPSWSDFPMTGSFLPLIRDLLAASIPLDHGLLRLECGMPLPALANLVGQETSKKDGAQPALDTRVPGVGEIGGTPVQVNVSRRESALDQTNLYDLKHILAATPPTDTAQTETPSTAKPLDLWHIFAQCAAIAFAMEMLLASLLDRREIAGMARQT